ncbi:MAG: VOC family protein, partial [Candidatus Heimdallarchaeota archaeon]
TGVFMADNPMKIKNIYFQISVDDLVRAKEFYEKVFDFDVAWYMSPEVGWCEFNLPGGARLGLNARLDNDNKKPSWGILTIEVQNLEESREYLDKKGLNPTEIVDNPGMVSYFNIKDTEDNAVQIVSEPRIKP